MDPARYADPTPSETPLVDVCGSFSGVRVDAVSRDGSLWQIGGRLMSLPELAEVYPDRLGGLIDVALPVVKLGTLARIRQRYPQCFPPNPPEQREEPDRLVWFRSARTVGPHQLSAVSVNGAYWCVNGRRLTVDALAESHPDLLEEFTDQAHGVLNVGGLASIKLRYGHLFTSRRDERHWDPNPNLDTEPRRVGGPRAETRPLNNRSRFFR